MTSYFVTDPHEAFKPGAVRAVPETAIATLVPVDACSIRQRSRNRVRSSDIGALTGDERVSRKIVRIVSRPSRQPVTRRICAF